MSPTCSDAQNLHTIFTLYGSDGEAVAAFRKQVT
jgi:hypothetical protein